MQKNTLFFRVLYKNLLAGRVLFFALRYKKTGFWPFVVMRSHFVVMRRLTQNEAGSTF